DRTIGPLRKRPGPLLRLTKGVHIVTRHAVEQAHVLFAKSDGRLFFVVPWRDATIVGMTDTDYTGDPGNVAASEAGVRYIEDEARRAFPSAPFDEIYFTWAGVRALVREEGVSEGQVSRKHALFDHATREGVEGVLYVLGGKITAYRAIAEEVVDVVSRRLSRNGRSRTADEPLPGARAADLTARPGDLALEATTRAHLTSIYGGRAREVLHLALDQGTTGSSAIVFDEAGAIRGSADREIRQSYPASAHVEHDPDEIFATTIAVGRDALARAGIAAKDVAAIGITNQRETTVVWER